jgi:hypothetical protein
MALNERSSEPITFAGTAIVHIKHYRLIKSKSSIFPVISFDYQEQQHKKNSRQ